VVLLLGKAAAFPFQAKCIAAKIVSPIRKGETVRVLRMAPEDECSADMLVLIRWQGRTLALPLSQLAAVDVDQSTADAIGDWHVVGGEDDPITPIADSEDIAPALPRELVRFERFAGCGHGIVLDAPERFLEVVRDFLKQ
jgi:pimeloyl-ACP methyl ester carboxylesterase